MGAAARGTPMGSSRRATTDMAAKKKTDARETRGRLTAATRRKIPKSEFGLPSKAREGPRGGIKKGSYPMPDKKHARLAKADASKEEHAGKLSKADERKIDAKADRKLDEIGGKPKSKIKKKK